MTIELHDDKPTVGFSAMLTGGDGRALPDWVQSCAVTTGWRMEDGQWKICVAEWEPVL